MSKEEIKVMYADPEAATYRTDIKGWVSRLNHYYGDNSTSEHVARYDGCTHRICEKCQGEYSKNSYCKACSAKNRQDKYEKMQSKEYNGEPLVIYGTETYFFHDYDLEDYCDSEGVKKEDLELVICEPQYAREIEIDELYEDILPEDTTVDYNFPALAEKVDELNKFIRESQHVVSWLEGNYKPIFKEKENVTDQQGETPDQNDKKE